MCRAPFRTGGMAAGGAHIAYEKVETDPHALVYPGRQPEKAGIFTLEETVQIILNFNAAASEMRGEYTKVRSPYTLFGLLGTHITRPEQIKEIRGPEPACLNPI